MRRLLLPAIALAASGLPQYRGRGGLKEWNLAAFTAVDLSGNFLDGGFSPGLAPLVPNRVIRAAVSAP